MKLSRKTEHTIDFLFTLSLFFVFAVLGLVLVIFSLQAYGSISENTDNNYRLRTTSSYVAQKLRHTEQIGRVTVGDLEGGPALILSQNYSGEEYLTYIYASDGALRELFVKAGTAISAADGKALLPVTEFSVQQEEKELFSISITDNSGRVLTQFWASRT